LFKKAKINDAKFLYRLRYDKDANQYSLNSKKISYIDHLVWLHKFMKNKRSAIYIFQDYKGYLRVDYSNKKCFLSWSIAKLHRKKGNAYIMLDNFLKKTKLNCVALIKKNNFASIKLVKKIGYVNKREYNGVINFLLKK
jgi:hypothetical protein